jgi:lysozyme
MEGFLASLIRKMVKIFVPHSLKKNMQLNIGVEQKQVMLRKMEHGENKNMNISKEGLALIKRFEGCELKAYRCPANVLTIGYGVTKNVTEDMEITQQEADDMLDEELIEYTGYINDMVKVPLDQSQFDALSAWIYNLGPTNFKDSTLLKVLNEEKYAEVPQQIKRWNKANGQVLDGLVRRREAEALLFEGKEWHKV